MNNHGIICKNNNMIIFLLILIISIILLNQKVKLDINFSILNLEYYFCVRIYYIFEIVTLYKEDFNKKNKKQNKIKDKNKLGMIKDFKGKIDALPLHYFNVEQIHYEMKIGLYDSVVTSLIIPILSTLSAISLQKYFPKASKQFSIEPKYNDFFFSTKGVVKVSVKLQHILYLLIHVLLNRNKFFDTKVNQNN